MDDSKEESKEKNISSIVSNVQSKKLITIRLVRQGLTIVPISLYQLCNLKRLDLSHNAITSISPGISTLPKLVSLDLSHNKLKTVPSELKDCPRLRYLHLQSNCIRGIPKEIGEAQLDTHPTSLCLLLIDLRNNPLNKADTSTEHGEEMLRYIFGDSLICHTADLGETQQLEILLRTDAQLTRKRQIAVFVVFILFLVSWNIYRKIYAI